MILLAGTTPSFRSFLVKCHPSYPSGQEGTGSFPRHDPPGRDHPVISLVPREMPPLLSLRAGGDGFAMEKEKSPPGQEEYPPQEGEVVDTTIRIALFLNLKGFP